MGLAPIFCFWWVNGACRVSFHLAFWTGLALGVMAAFGKYPQFLAIGMGKYGSLLSINLYGLLLCTGLFFLPLLVRNGLQRLLSPTLDGMTHRSPLSASSDL